MPTIKDALDIIGKLTVAEQESLKTMDFGGVWEQYLAECGVVSDYYDIVAEYEHNILSKRK